MDPSKFCEAMDTWAGIMCAQSDEFAEHWNYIRFKIHKSCLLDRLLYGGEQLRTEKCPVHEGIWSGCTFSDTPCACVTNGNVTGWLPLKDVEVI